MNNTLRLFVFLVVSGAVILLARSVTMADDPAADPADWPMYQYNPQHTGFNDHSTLRPPLVGAWSRSVFDSATNLREIVVVDGKILVSHRDNLEWYDTWERYLRCLDVETGEVIWDRGFGVNVAMYPPAAGYGLAYVQIGNGFGSRIVGLDLNTGELQWTVWYHEQGGDRFPPMPYQGYLVTTGGTYEGTIVVDAHSGEPQWFFDIGIHKMGWSAYQDRIYVFSVGYFICRDLETGDRLWDYYVNDTASGTSNYMQTLPILDTIRQVAYLAWRKSITAVSLTSHQQLWQTRGDYEAICGGYMWGGIQPAFAYDQLFVIDSGILKSLDCETGQELWRYTGDSMICAPPVVANGYVYASGQSAYHAINITTHQCVDEPEQGPGFGGYLAIAQDKLFQVGQNGIIVCYQNLETDVDDNTGSIQGFALHQNYPNPFNPSTTIRYSLPTRGKVSLTIYNLLGQTIQTLTDQTESAGEHEVTWDGRDVSGEPVASGVYLYRLTTDNGTLSRKMLLLK